MAECHHGVFASVSEGSEVHGRDYHKFILNKVLYGLMHPPQDEFIIAGNLKHLMFWCKQILTSEVDMKNVGGWQVTDEVFLVQGIYILNILKIFQSIEGGNDPGICFFKFPVGQQFEQTISRGDIQDSESVGDHLPHKEEVLICLLCCSEVVLQHVTAIAADL